MQSKLTRIRYEIESSTFSAWKVQARRLFARTVLFVCVEVLRPSQPNGVMSSAVSLPNHTFTGVMLSAVSLPNHTFTGQAQSSQRLTNIVHILSPETDNCPS